MAATFETLLRIDAALVTAGHPPLTDWWKTQLERFYSHPTARALVARVGRGGVKSHTSAKVGLNETIFGDWRVPLGERHFWAFVSISKDEAAQRLQLLGSFLRSLAIEFDVSGDEIALRETPRGFRVFAAVIGAVSGFRSYGYSIDELAKLRSAERFSDPAPEVCASLNAMTVTHDGARRLLISSPVSLVDYHCKRYEIGDTDAQLTCQAPTWIANPSLSEEQTHVLEPDDRIWRREYQATPQAAALAAFDVGAVDRAFAWNLASARGGARVGIIDASSGKKDSWTWAVCAWRELDGMRRLVFDKVGSFGGRFWEQLSGDKIVAVVSDEFKSNGVTSVHGDQRESLMLSAAFRRNGLRFYEHPWTAPSKERSVGQLRRWLADGLIVLPVNEDLRAELLSFEEKSTQSGGFTFGARGNGHDDYVALLLTSAMADADRKIPCSPQHRMRMKDALAALTAGTMLRLEEQAAAQQPYGGRRF
jgi:hypothetical protein